MEHEDQAQNHPPSQPTYNSGTGEPPQHRDNIPPATSHLELHDDAARATIANKKIAIIGIIIASTLAILAILIPLLNRPNEGNPGAGHSQSAPSAGVGSTPAIEVTSPAGVLDVGTCLPDSSTNAPVSCELPHATEVFDSLQICNEKNLITYLKGNPAVDILRNDLTIQVQPGGYCTVTFPPSMTVTTSMKEALSRPDTAFLRQCVNRVSGADVNCTEKHTGEVVAEVGKGDTRPVKCDDAATTYMNRSPADLYRLLMVSQENSSDGFRCIIDVNGSNQLTNTLRMLGTSSVPITPY